MFDATRAESSDPARQALPVRPVLRIFISSTAIDLTGYRDKVRDAVLRLENLPIAMETFSALGGAPASECMRMAAEADAVICIVAHRYGYVPPVELGGDGERSITWLEVDAAKRAGKPVFAFLVDPKAPWTEVKEQDRLVSEPEKAAEVFKAVRKLQEFKAYLDRGIRQTFNSAEELAKLVAIALANFAPHSTATAHVWQPLFCHALQPAQHFRGREAKLLELKDWLQSPVTPDRVISVVAAGGTGKTALVNQALHEATLSDRAGVFVWSFYEDPHTDAFLRAAYTYFTGEKDAPAGGMLERLQLALSGDAPHVLVLDGLERVQSEGDRGRRGELEDLQLKRLVRALAGGVGNARALVTSRFPLVDLENWTGAGHRAIALDDLELPVALDVLRAWGVKGDDAALARTIEPLNIGGFYHALSVAVLGSYLGNFAGGDPNRAPEFSLEDTNGSDDPKARKLHRILEEYARALTAVERDLLARLSLFPRGVKVELLGWIVQFGGEVAGALIGLDDRGLVGLLERLRALGLVFRYETDRQVVYSAHPFLREFFRNLLGTKPESVHESVRSRLAPSLEARPSKPPRNPAILDQYELLIEQTLLAGRVREAFDLYWYGLGGYGNLGWVLGDNARGLRILERFVPQDDYSLIEPRLPWDEQAALVNALGLFARNLGELARARGAFVHSRLLWAGVADQRNASVAERNLADVELFAGHFRQALEHSESALALATRAEDEAFTKNSLVWRATAHLALGEISAAVADFQRATELQGGALYSTRAISEAEGKLLRGEWAGALSQTQANRESCVRYDWNDDLCRCNALLARLLLTDDPARAAQHLQDARAFANRSGEVELQLRCFHAASKLQCHLGDYPQSIAEAEAGLLLADACGCGSYSIDLRLSLAETYLAAGNAAQALQNARNALDRSEQRDCQYAWGKADGLHFCGMAHLRLGERELARQRLTAAQELRQRLGHGRIEETRRAMESLTA
jgi:tetratricopeptide (TPR) repeat protein